MAVLFSDLVGFTQIAASLAPRDLVAELNELLRSFDAAATRLGVEKIKTMGDAYLAVAGLTESETDPVVAAVSLAIEMRDTVVAAADRWHIRIGVHAGPVVAGVIGTRKFAYDVWGDTVERGEQAGVHGTDGWRPGLRRGRVGVVRPASVSSRAAGRCSRERARHTRGWCWAPRRTVGKPAPVRDSSRPAGW